LFLFVFSGKPAQRAGIKKRQPSGHSARKREKPAQRAGKRAKQSQRPQKRERWQSGNLASF